MKVTNELIAKAKTAKTMEELTVLMNEEGAELNAEQIEKIYALLHESRELSDEELDNVSGGCGEKWKCPKCGCTDFSTGLAWVVCANCGATWV